MTRKWRKLVNGEMLREIYTLEQPQLFALYRLNFNAIDVANKYSFGPGSLVNVLGT